MIEKTSDIRNIPFLTQKVYSHSADGFKNQKQADFWEKRGCGITCVRMLATGVYGAENVPHYADFIKQGLAKKAYLRGKGWIHQGLVNILSEYGILAFSNVQKNIQNLADHLRDDYVCIASVSSCFNPNKKGGHLILVNGITPSKENGEQQLIVHHPHYKEENNLANHPVLISRFNKSFSGNYIACKI